MSIDKYLSIIINPTVIDRRIRLEYLQSELVEHASQLRHALAREALLLHKIETAMEITSIGDLPGRSRSGFFRTYLVALLAALHAYRRTAGTPMEIAEEACNIEIVRLKEPVGKQDQYMAALGGLRCLEISTSGEVKTHTVALSQSALHEFIGNTHMYYIGSQRNASSILRLQNDAALDKKRSDHHAVVDNLQRNQGNRLANSGCLEGRGIRSVRQVAGRSLAVEEGHECGDHHISSRRALSCGENGIRRTGGKIIGAGGGGFLMLYCPRNHTKLMRYMQERGIPPVALWNRCARCQGGGRS